MEARPGQNWVLFAHAVAWGPCACWKIAQIEAGTLGRLRMRMSDGCDEIVLSAGALVCRDGRLTSRESRECSMSLLTALPGHALVREFPPSCQDLTAR